MSSPTIAQMPWVATWILLPLGSHEAEIRLSVGLGSYPEAWGKNLLASSFRLSAKSSVRFLFSGCLSARVLSTPWLPPSSKPAIAHGVPVTLNLSDFLICCQLQRTLLLMGSCDLIVPTQLISLLQYNVHDHRSHTSSHSRLHPHSGGGRIGQGGRDIGPICRILPP